MKKLLTLLIGCVMLSGVASSKSPEDYKKEVAKAIDRDLSHIKILLEKNMPDDMWGFTCSKNLIMINPKFWNDKMWSTIRKRIVVMHEIGHSFGLHHDINHKRVYKVLQGVKVPIFRSVMITPTRFITEVTGVYYREHYEKTLKEDIDYVMNEGLLELHWIFLGGESKTKELCIIDMNREEK